MTRRLLDASALLALLLREKGAARVRECLPDRESAITSVNAAEVIARLVDEGYSAEEAEDLFSSLMVDTKDFSAAAGWLAGRLRANTRHRGLSLGDRACLAAAMHGGYSVLTADRQWAALDLDLDIEVIR